jgi:parallel beta-helix repeat protein
MKNVQKRKLGRLSVLLMAGAGAMALVPLTGVGTAGASGASSGTSTVYVTNDGSCGNRPSYSTIAAGLAAAPPNGTVIVCGGTFNEDAVITQPVTLISRGAVINPSAPVVQTNSPLYSKVGNNGITIAAPNVTVQGFTVTGATGDGIFSFANNSTITDNESNGNGSTGISLNGSSWSRVAGDVTNKNAAGGITLTNDAGAIIPGATASHDVVTNNVSNGNLGGCGIILADHLGSTVPGAQGIFDNVVTDNTVNNNGNVPAASGAGVILATEAPGGAVYSNLIANNDATGNGLAGVTFHSHMAGQNFTGNVVTSNTFGPNNGGGDFADPSTTGVYLGSVSPLTVKVTNNNFINNVNGIFAAGPVTVLGVWSNSFRHVTVPLATTPTYAG